MRSAMTTKSEIVKKGRIRCVSNWLERISHFRFHSIPVYGSHKLEEVCLAEPVEARGGEARLVAQGSGEQEWAHQKALA